MTRWQQDIHKEKVWENCQNLTYLSFSDLKSLVLNTSHKYFKNKFLKKLFSFHPYSESSL